MWNGTLSQTWGGILQTATTKIDLQGVFELQSSCSVVVKVVPLLLLELAHRGADVACRDHVRLALDRGLDDVGVVDVRDEGDDKVVLRDLLLELGLFRGVLRTRVKRECSRVREVSSQRFGALQRTAGCETGSDRIHAVGP